MIDLRSIAFIGAGLNRPECVLTHRSGRLFVPDWTDGGGVAIVEPNGAVRRLLNPNPSLRLRPNGIALEPGGSFLLAHLGEEEGGVYRLHPDGSCEPILLAIDGYVLPPTNFIHRDAKGRLWVTVSTRRRPRALGYRPDADDGFIVLADNGAPRIVADGLGYTNECLVSPDGTRLYVNETFGRRLTAFPIAADGTLGKPEIVARFGAGTFPDGKAFDADGAIWITSIVSNRVIRVRADGRQDLAIEDCDPEHLAQVEAAFQSGTMGRSHLDRIVSRRLRNISSLAFGGPDLATGYLGCLLGDAIAVFPAPRPGHRPPHYDFDLGPLDDQ